MPEQSTENTVIEIYRASSSPIKKGDHVTVTRESVDEYLGKRSGSALHKIYVPVKDIVRSGGKITEAIYSPLEREYTRTLNLKNKGDVEYIKRSFDSGVVQKMKDGVYKYGKLETKEAFEDHLKSKIVSERIPPKKNFVLSRIKEIKHIPQKLYHGTSSKNIESILSSGFKASSEIKTKDFVGGGGYGQTQKTVSFSKNPSISARFYGNSNEGALFEVSLKPDAKIVEFSGVNYAEDIDDYVSELKKQGVDAVYLQDEEEFVLINRDKIKIENVKKFRPTKWKEDLGL